MTSSFTATYLTKINEKYVRTETYTEMFMAASLLLVPTGNNPIVSQQFCYIHTVEYYLATKMELTPDNLSKTDKPPNCHAEWKKPSTNEYIL